MRDVISIGKLVRKSDGPQEIELIMKTLTRYGATSSDTAGAGQVTETSRVQMTHVAYFR